MKNNTLRSWAATLVMIPFLVNGFLQARTWTSSDGKATFEGEVKAYDAATGKVTITRADGRELTFSQDKLSKADIEHLKSTPPPAPAAESKPESAVKTGGSSTTTAESVPDSLPDPDGKEADMTKPVQVFILMGQSNMVGFGKVEGEGEGTLENAVKTKKLYPYLVDDAGAWTARKDVMNISNISGSIQTQDWLTVPSAGDKVGVELPIGHVLGEAIDAPVLLLKSCIGNRALGWDLLPPGSESWEFKDPKSGKTMIYAGYGQSPMKWEKGTEPEPMGWHAGLQYDLDVGNAKSMLEDIGSSYPGAKSYEVAGFFWWQGEKDTGDAGLASRYEHNLVNFIKSLRKDFNSPNAKFVMATLGEVKKGASGNAGAVFDAMFAVDSKEGKHSEFKGNVATVYANPLSKGGSGNGHYGGNAETYVNVGEAMGRAMADMLKGK